VVELLKCFMRRAMSKRGRRSQVLVITNTGVLVESEGRDYVEISNISANCAKCPLRSLCGY
jgi:hypothetical protein